MFCMKMQIATKQKEKETRQREVTCGGVEAVLLAVEARWPAIFSPFSSFLFFLFSFIFPLPSVVFSLSLSFCFSPFFCPFMPLLCLCIYRQRRVVKMPYLCPVKGQGRVDGGCQLECGRPLVRSASF
jgi:hypothetical protein